MRYKLPEVVDDYYNSYDFNILRDETKKEYHYHIGVMLDTVVEGKAIRERYCDKVSSRMAKLSYNQWCERGIYLANHVLSASRILFNHGLHMEMLFINPFISVKKRPVSVRSTVWSREQVRTFLDTAYSDFSTRNVGLIAQMAYEWCQRLGDMRMLTWDSLDLDACRVHIKQSKRKAEVFLPIEQQLNEMLTEQKQDFGFQDYIAPMTEPIRGVYHPYTIYRLPKVARRVMRDAGLPESLRLSDLRRTGTTEMVEAGVSMGNIMSVTGHANPQSVKPYMKNTFASADLALTTRKKHDI